MSQRLYFLTMAEANDYSAKSHAASMAAAHCRCSGDTMDRAKSIAFYSELAKAARDRAAAYRQLAEDFP